MHGACPLVLQIPPPPFWPSLAQASPAGLAAPSPSTHPPRFCVLLVANLYSRPVAGLCSFVSQVVQLLHAMATYDICHPELCELLALRVGQFMPWQFKHYQVPLVLPVALYMRSCSPNHHLSCPTTYCTALPKGITLSCRAFWPERGWWGLGAWGG